MRESPKTVEDLIDLVWDLAAEAGGTDLGDALDDAFACIERDGLDAYEEVLQGLCGAISQGQQESGVDRERQGSGQQLPIGIVHNAALDRHRRRLVAPPRREASPPAGDDAPGEDPAFVDFDWTDLRQPPPESADASALFARRSAESALNDGQPAATGVRSADLPAPQIREEVAVQSGEGAEFIDREATQTNIVRKVSRVRKSFWKR